MLLLVVFQGFLDLGISLFIYEETLKSLSDWFDSLLWLLEFENPRLAACFPLVLLEIKLRYFQGIGSICRLHMVR